MKSEHKWWILVSALLLFLTAPALIATAEDEKQGEIDIQEYIRGASLQNGESIYYYGINLWRQRVPFAGGPHWLYRHGGGCVQCHGPEGRGGIWPMMCNVKSPAVTYQALTGEAHEHEDVKRPSEGKEGESEKYTIRGIQTAIEQGIEPDGNQLNWCMPRWGLSPVDFRDLLAFLVYLDGGKK